MDLPAWVRWRAREPTSLPTDPTTLHPSLPPSLPTYLPSIQPASQAPQIQPHSMVRFKVTVKRAGAKREPTRKGPLRQRQDGGDVVAPMHKHAASGDLDAGGESTRRFTEPAGYGGCFRALRGSCFDLGSVSLRTEGGDYVSQMGPL